MTSPRTPEDLGKAIETLLGSYIDEVRQAAQQAIERSLVRPGVARRLSKGGGHRPSAVRSGPKRRTAAELDEVCEQLCTLVRARPGESMATLVEEMGVSSGALVRPMAKLRAEGRVRSVGERHMMRYFPAVARPGKG